MNKLSFLPFIYLLLLVVAPAAADDTTPTTPDFWRLADDGAIAWTYDGRAHEDHIEMSGRRVSVVLRYGLDERGRLRISRGMVWPMLRTLPNDTHGSLQRQLSWNPLEAVNVRRSMVAVHEWVQRIALRGMMEIDSRSTGLGIHRIIAPSPELPALVERIVLKNIVDRPIEFQIDDRQFEQVVPAAFCVDGPYVVRQVLQGAGTYKLAPGDSVQFSVLTGAWKQGLPMPEWSADREIEARRALVGQWMDNLVLESPDAVLDRMFAFSKIRSQESIFATKGGPLHGPGGEAYYAAIWANDQAEYANPFFPFTGYGYASASALNSYLHFARYMNPDYKPMPSSIIAEGDGYWNGAGDRGDAAMIAYGAARYALARGSRDEAEQLWPLIQWCLEYCRRQLNDQGVVRSNSDELEGRFPAGEANLCTSSLYYDALRSASMLARDLSKSSRLAKQYDLQARALEQAIDRYFHATVEGFDTYRYYVGNKVLRSWICIPLTMGIFTRAQGTLDALYSPRLWTRDGMLTQAGSETFWDRTTLYALRGALMAGDTERTLSFLQYYSRTRLLGAHVPYAIEAWPEGSQRHLSAESALYARIITEGLFGIRPTGLRSFSVTPRLPESWPSMRLRRLHLAGQCLDLEVRRDAHGRILVTASREGHKPIQRTCKRSVSFAF
ncbi:MAG: hypothetical protein IJK15_02175 [Bacteroidaceae bacterium]|nr:hypothetical protein [Bacteroidaceae bacterium]